MMNSTKTKRIGSWLLTLVLLASMFSVLGVSALADETPSATLSIKNVVDKGNGTLTADVYLDRNNTVGILGGAMKFTVSDGLTLTKIAGYKSGVPGLSFMGTEDVVRDKIGSFFINIADTDDNGDPYEAWTGSGKLATLTFTVNKDAYGNQFVGIMTVEQNPNTAITGDDVSFAVSVADPVLAYQLDSRLTFDANYEGGTAPAEILAKTGAAVTLLTPVRTGYDFTGWYKEADCTTKFEGATMPDGDTKLYAGWKLQEYTVTLNANGGSVTPASLKVEYGEKYPALPVPAQEGFNFVGWYCGEKLVKEGDALAESKNHTLTAKWEEKGVISLDETAQHFTYGDANIAFAVKAAGTSTIPTGGFKVEYYVDGAYTETAPTKAGSYNVKITRAKDADWKACEKVITGGLVIDKKSVAEPAEDATTFTYDGEKKTYTVAANDLYTVSGNEQTDAGTHSVTIALKDKDNYKWTKADSSDDLSYSFVIAKAEQAAPTGIEATAETISGKADGKLSGLSKDMEYSLDGKTWTTAAGKNAEDLAAGEYQIRLAETTNYKASPVTKVTVAAGKKLVVSFNTNGGSAAANQELSWQGTVAAPTTTKDGYKLEGWYKDAKLSQAWDLAKDKVEADMTLNAKWAYTVTATADKFTVGSASDGLTVTVGKGLKLTKANLKNIYVNGAKLDTASYTVSDANDLTVTLTKDYLNTLKAATYTVQIDLKDVSENTADSVSINLTVNEKTETAAAGANTAKKAPVKTGDSSNVLLWSVLVIGCGAGVTGIVLWDKKRRNN